MGISVIYSTESFPHKNSGRVGRQSEPVLFATLDKANATQLPAGYVFALIPVENGYHTYSKTLGWEDHLESCGTSSS